ncbi:ABC transporter substrate-binding protein, partial [Burkholderia multivorans]
PNFEKYVAEANPDATVEYRNANQDASQQQQQFEAAVTEGVDVIVLDPVDASAVASSLAKAEAKQIPVVSYDRFFDGADYYTSFDNKKIGNLQGQALLDGLKAKGVDPKSGPVWMVNGDPKDPHAADFKAGAEENLTAASVDLTPSHAPLDWHNDAAWQGVVGQM